MDSFGIHKNWHPSDWVSLYNGAKMMILSNLCLSHRIGSRRSIATGIFAFIMILGTIICPSYSQTHDWQTEIIDYSIKPDKTTDRALALDSNDLPHVVFGGIRLYYSTYDGTTWHVERVDADPHFGLHPELFLDEDDVPHIIYGGANGVRYACYDSGNWTIENLDDRVSRHHAIVQSSDGFVHAVWSTEEGPIYAMRDQTGWSSARVDSLECDYTSITVDTSGKAHIVYEDSRGLRYAYKGDIGWEYGTIDDRGGAYTSMDFDSTGQLHLSYVVQEDRVIYACFTGVWTKQEIDHATYEVNGTSIQIDVNDNPHIGYYLREYNDRLMYAYKNEEWHYETVVYGDFYTGFPSIAIGSNDKTHVTYSDRYGYSFHYGHSSLNGWQLQTITYRHDLGHHCSLDIDSEYKPHIAYYDDGPDDLKYAVLDGTDWMISVVDSSGSVGEYAALRLDSLDRPHIVYHDATNSALKYAYLEESSWNICLVDSGGWRCGANCALVLDSAGIPHISYGGYGELRYAFQSCRGWQIEMVDPLDDWSQYLKRTSIRIDPDDQPAIAYAVGIHLGSTVWYAHRDHFGWNSEMIGMHLDAPSMSFDHLGEVQIAIRYYRVGVYPSESISKLLYMYLEGSTWVYEEIDSQGYTGENPSFVLLKNNGNRFISYHSHTGGKLQFAWSEEENWKNETVFDDPVCGSYSSLAVDDRDAIHIAFNHETNGDLMYAFSTGVAAEISPATQNLSLVIDSPSPVPGPLHLSVCLETSGLLKLAAYDISGREVRLINDDTRQRGNHRILWDLRDNAGRLLPPGVYICVADDGNSSISKRIVFLR